MAAFARCPRPGALYASAMTAAEWSPMPSAADEPAKANTSDPQQQAEDDGNAKANKRKPRGNRKWKRLDLESTPADADATIADGIWGGSEAIPVTIEDCTCDLAPSSSHQPTRPSGQHQPSQPKPNPRPQKWHQRRKPAKMAAANEKREYIPPHLRVRQPGASQAMPKEPDAAQNAIKTQEDEIANGKPGPSKHRPKSPPSPPSSPAQDNAPTWGGWQQGDGQSKHVQQSAWSNKRRWPKPPRKMVWPKNRDMKAQAGAMDDESDGGVSCKSNSNGDPNYDVRKLMDWNGDWLPPPEQWWGRKTFTDRHFGAHIEKWMNGVEAYGADNIYLDITSEEFTAPVNGDIAPRLWIPTQIENDPPQQFWRTFPSRAPAPLSDVDLNELRPWWESAKKENCYLPPLDVPEAEIDMAEEDNCLPGARLCSEEAVRRLAFAKQERFRRIMEKRNRPMPPIMTAYEVPDRSLKPTANIYLRPVIPADAKQLTELYNHYVRETIKANEFRDRTPFNIAGRIDNVIGRGLPWIVAVDKGNHSKNRQYVNEKVVGFVAIDDHVDEGSMYRFTFEMDMYVDPNHLRQGISKCMLDKLLDIVDPGYRARGGYDWICRGDYLKNGCRRVVKNINVVVPHEHANNSEIEWLTPFLKAFGFRKSGHIHMMGYKKGKVVDVTYFQHITAEYIDPNLNPTMPL